MISKCRLQRCSRRGTPLCATRTRRTRLLFVFSDASFVANVQAKMPECLVCWVDVVLEPLVTEEALECWRVGGAAGACTGRRSRRVLLLKVDKREVGDSVRLLILLRYSEDFEAGTPPGKGSGANAESNR
jgi:hypothetical protein